MSIYHQECVQCGNVFTAYRGPGRSAPKFCSYDCYWAAPHPSRGKIRTEYPASGRRQVSRRADDGSIVHTLRARWVWNQNHPDDPAGSDEHIHHIDGDPLNDDPDNLQKFTAEAHLDVHRTFKRPGAEELSRRMLAYHKANPGKMRKGQSKTCPVCGTEFYRPPSAKAETCSYTCMGKLSSERRRHKTK